MSFIGKVWRLLVGIKDALVLLFMLLFFGGLYAALSATPTVSAGARGVLLLDIKGAIVEQPVPVDPFDLLSGHSPATREYRLRDLVKAIDTAADDDRVQAIALDVDIFTGGGQVAISTVGKALDRVRKAGKPVIAFASGYTDDSYQLAAHASEIWLDPLGAVFVKGPGGNGLYFKGLLDKVGVTANVYRAGTYKAATEPFTRNDMSPEARQDLQALAGALWNQWQEEVRRARPKAQIDAYISSPEATFGQANGDMAKAAQAAGLIDRIGDRIAYGKRLAEIVGTDQEQRPGSFKKIGYDAWRLDHPAGDDSGSVGVLTVAGNIVDGEADPGTAGAETIVKLLNDGLVEKDLKALVVRVDSPGGSVYASERIRRALLSARAQGIPVVVSMGSVAASGGYWIATAADRVLAEPGTITGSIGVFGILPSFEGMIQKLGLGSDGVRTTPLSGEPDLLRGPSDTMDKLIQMGVDNMYRRFVSIVAQARKLPAARVDQIGQGRVWDGGTARQLGLVDGFGSLDEAVAEAARLAKIDKNDATLVYLEEEPGFFESLLLTYETEEETSNDAFASIVGEPRRLLATALGQAQSLLSGPTIQARCLECAAAAPIRNAGDERTLRTAIVHLLMP